MVDLRWNDDEGIDESMAILMVVTRKWTARLAKRLAAVGVPVAAVAITDPTLRQWWLKGESAVTGAPALMAAEQPVAVGEPVTVLAELTDDVPEWVLRRTGPSAERIRFSVQHEGKLTASDPVHWMIRNGLGGGAVVLDDATGGVGTSSSAFTIPRVSYVETISAVATALKEALHQRKKAVGQMDGKVLVSSYPTDRLSYPILKTYVDWQADAEAIVRLVVACRGGSSPALSDLKGFCVTIGRARFHGTTSYNVPPGVVIGYENRSILVQSGSGVVALDDVRDLVGPVAPEMVPVGTRFGIDPAEEIRDLRARVADLEYLTHWLASSRAGHVTSS
ncbi:hypothetical protein ACQP26_19665 [Micromonospora sp. CA-248089]|uniref:hypothetical protein n=1 Tax=Micromonospora sp. CA-248089 TaxID=3239960 RepID=UPI003D8DB98F